MRQWGKALLTRATPGTGQDFSWLWKDMDQAASVMPPSIAVPLARVNHGKARPREARNEKRAPDTPPVMLPAVQCVAADGPSVNALDRLQENLRWILWTTPFALIDDSLENHLRPLFQALGKDFIPGSQFDVADDVFVFLTEVDNEKSVGLSELPNLVADADGFAHVLVCLRCSSPGPDRSDIFACPLGRPSLGALRKENRTARLVS
jgi:hypothetical protein